jgi:hypothetical protein
MSTSGLLDADPRWFRVVPSTLTLRPGKIGYVSVHLSIPQTAKAGDYVAFVTASPKQNVQKASSAIVLGAGTRVLFKVKGAPVETGAVRNTTNPRKPLPWNTLLFAFAALLGLSSFGFAAKHLKITVRWRK